MTLQRISLLARRRSKSQSAAVHNGLTWLVCLFHFLLFVSTVSAQGLCQDYLCEREPRRVALVIGNESYTNLPPIPSAKSDAELMQARLTELGFVVDYPQR